MSKHESNTIITIARTFGSGGREIGKIVAKELGIPCYDKEILEVAAKNSRVSFEELDRLDERKSSNIFYSQAINPYTYAVSKVGSLDAMVLKIQVRAIETVANEGPCVIIGRRADKILADNHDILSVFISASMDKRIARVSKRDGLSEKDSQDKILKADKARRSYYNSYGEGDWGEAANYNLCIDSGDLGSKHAAAIILKYLELKGKRL